MPPSSEAQLQDKNAIYIFTRFTLVIYQMTVPALPGTIFQFVLLETDNNQIFTNKISL